MKLKRLKFVELAKCELDEREQLDLRGGDNCSCGCHYANSGGSDFCTNGSTNIGYSYTSYGGGTSCAPCIDSEASTFSFWNRCK